MIRYRRFLKLALASVTAISALVLLSAASCEDSLPTIEAQLVAPPGVPAPINRARAHVVVRLETIEKEVEIAPGVQYKIWTFNGTVPGPMIRVRVGDEVEVHLKNNSTSEMTHNIDLHAVNGPGGGAGATTVAPGEEKTFTFKAKAAGFYVYHCAAGIVADHIGNGMYGGILVEPGAGLPRVDREYYLAQGEFYTSGDTGEKGRQTLDTGKLLAEQPAYVVFNGDTKALQGEKALKANVREAVRLFVANGGPNFTSSFHVIGEIFDDVYPWGSFTSGIQHDVQTVSVPPGGAVVVAFNVDVPGDYKLVDHAISRVSKGALGTLTVTGEEDPAVFKAGGASAASGHDMTPAAGASTPAPTSAPSGPATTVKVSMKDNFFEPKDISVNAGSTVTFELTNAGKAIHNMRIADSRGSYTSRESVVSDPELISSAKSGALTWAVPGTAGVTYKFRCDIHPDQMTGTITIK